MSSPGFTRARSNRKPLSRLDGRGVWGEGRIARITFIATVLTAGGFLAGNHTSIAYSVSTPTLTACPVAPRSPSDVITLLESTDIATPVATTEGSTLPRGTPASASERQAINETIASWLACQNAGEPLRAWSLFTDGYLYRLLGREAGLSEADLVKLATPTPSSAEPAVIKDITDARLLPDGRLGASVTVSYASVPMPKRFFFYFVRHGDGMQIDSILGEISFSVP